jgi:hypothetical protein
LHNLYAVHVSLPATARDGRDSWDAVADILASWARDWAGDVVVNGSSEGSWESKDGSSSRRWVIRSGQGGTLFRLDTRQVAHGDDWRWVSSIWLGREHSGRWLRVRVGLELMADGVVVPPHVKLDRPSFLSMITAAVDLSVDGRGIGAPMSVTSENVDAYLDLLLDPERRHPIVAITRGHVPSGIRADALVDRLFGLAHVVEITPAAAFRVSLGIGPARGVDSGAMRIYWPRFTSRSPPSDHPLYLPAEIDGSGPDQLIQDVVTLLHRSAAASLGAPDLERTLLREQRAAGIAERHRETLRNEERLRLAVDESRRNATTSKAEWEALFGEWESLLDKCEKLGKKVEKLERENLDLELEVEVEREARERAESSAQSAWRQLAEARPSADRLKVDRADDNREPVNVEDAVGMAARGCPHLVFLDEAFSSANESLFPRPAQVLEDLLILEGIAREWSEGRLKNGGFREVFRERLSGYKSGISDTARNSFAADYRRRYGGQEVMLGPHIRHGVGPPREILRIYWYVDNEKRRFVVGHVGCKLRDGSNG